MLLALLANVLLILCYFMKGLCLQNSTFEINGPFFKALKVLKVSKYLRYKILKISDTNTTVLKYKDVINFFPKIKKMHLYDSCIN